MSVRTSASRRLMVVRVAATVALGPVMALGPTVGVARAAAEGCSAAEEQIRSESNLDPVTGRPYSAQLPECRAYEMVSPLYKQSHDAGTNFHGTVPIAVSPLGDTVLWSSQGSFANPEGFFLNAGLASAYISQREGSGWATSSVFAPRRFVESVFIPGDFGDHSLDLRSKAVSCGTKALEGAAGVFAQALACASRGPEGTWTSTPLYARENNAVGGIQPEGYDGGSADLSRLFFALGIGAPLLPEDGNKLGETIGLYEISGVGTESPLLRLVNFENVKKGEKAHLVPTFTTGGSERPPLIGSQKSVGRTVGGTEQLGETGTMYHAVSESGETVFFTGRSKVTKVATVYARIPCPSKEGASERFAALQCEEEAEGRKVEGRLTVAVSDPSSDEGCAACKSGSTPQPAHYQGASADGSKVFFTTTQTLLNEDSSSNLYEYDFKAPEGDRLVDLTPDSNEANVGLGEPEGGGVVRTSSDGSHVYFVAGGVLTGNEKNPYGDEAKEGMQNLYGVDTNTGRIRFIAVLTDGLELARGWDFERHAQTTPDGRDLVFSTVPTTELATVSGDTNNPSARAVFRYEFPEEESAPGRLTWISKAAPGTAAPNAGQDAWVEQLQGAERGAFADFEDWSRAISGCPQGLGVSKQEEELCPPGAHDGEDILFTTKEKLQADDVSNGLQLYLWHCPGRCEDPAKEGVVQMISDGQDPLGVTQNNVTEPPAAATGSFGPSAAGLSASGSDIFFTTHTQLVGQDTDSLRDLYDARVEGGFPRPIAALPCAGEPCQGSAGQPPPTEFAPSSISAPGGNLTTPLSSALAFQTKVSKPLTRAQKLARALRECRKLRKHKRRASCERSARQRYGSKAKTPKSKSRHGRDA